MALVSLTSYEGHMSIFRISADIALIIPGYLALATRLELLPLLAPLLYYDIPLVSCSLKQIRPPIEVKVGVRVFGFLNLAPLWRD